MSGIMEHMEIYDEDVTQNSFFQALQREKPGIFEIAPTNGYIICVPRSSTFNKKRFNSDDFENHILQANEDAGLNFYRTLNNKNVAIANNIISTRNGFVEERVVLILFDETFFNKNDDFYQVLCIDQPLQGDPNLAEIASFKQRITLHNLSDCENLLWKKKGDERLGGALASLHQQLTTQLRLLKDPTVQTCVDMARYYYQKGFSLLMRDRTVKRRMQNDQDYSDCMKTALEKRRMQNDQDYSDCMKTALESYILHRVYKQLMFTLATALASQDASLNKMTRNLRHLQLKDLDVRHEYCQNVPRGRKEMGHLSRYTTPLGKLVCLKRVFRVLMQTRISSASGGTQAAANIPLSTDDFLPILVFIVVKADMAHWWTNFRYMTSFRFSRTTSDDDLGFFVATLEAALEHVSSGQLKQDLDARRQQEFNSPVTLPWQASDQQRSRSSIFFQLIRRNDVESAKRLVQEKAGVETEKASQDVELCHPLCECPRCLQRVARQQQSRDELTVTAHALDERGQSALHVAAGCGHTAIIDWLITQGLDVNVKDVQGQTPLHTACMMGKQSTALLLLHYKARPNVQDNEGNTALHLATRNGQEDCVKALIYYDQAATILDLDVANDFGDRPLHLAAKWAYYRICDILLENGAAVEACNRRNQKPRDVAHNAKVARRLSIAVQGDSDRGAARRMSTPARLLCSEKSTDTSVAGSAHSSHANGPEAISVGIATGAGLSPEQKERAARVDRLLKAVLDGDVQLVRFQLGWSDSDSESSSPDTSSLCHPLCQCPKCAPMQKLTGTSESGLHVNSQNVEGLSALHVAAQCGHMALLQLLLRRGAQTNLPSKAGVTPLVLALKNQRYEVVELLLSHRADATLSDSRHNTALHVAALVGSVEALIKLVQNGADVNAANVRGNTILHEAARAGHGACVRELLSRGAHVIAYNRKGQLPIHLTHRDEIRGLLLKYMQGSEEPRSMPARDQSLDPEMLASAPPFRGSLARSQTVTSEHILAEDSVQGSLAATAPFQAKTTDCVNVSSICSGIGRGNPISEPGLNDDWTTNDSIDWTMITHDVSSIPTGSYFPQPTRHVPSKADLCQAHLSTIVTDKHHPSLGRSHGKFTSDKSIRKGSMQNTCISYDLTSSRDDISQVGDLHKTNGDSLDAGLDSVEERFDLERQSSVRSVGGLSDCSEATSELSFKDEYFGTGSVSTTSTSISHISTQKAIAYVTPTVRNDRECDNMKHSESQNDTDFDKPSLVTNQNVDASMEMPSDCDSKSSTNEC